MSELKPFRYDDAFRLFDESLADIELTKKASPDYENEGGLQRIAEGKTALASLAPAAAAAAAGAPSDVQKEEVKQKLRELLAKNRQKVSAFCKEAAFGMGDATADNGTGFVPPSSMISGTGGTAPNERASSAPKEGFHQGPAANLLARSLKEHRQEEAAQLASNKM